MAELDFPDPNVAKEYKTDDVPGVFWEWDGEKWTSYAQESAVPGIIASGGDVYTYEEGNNKYRIHQFKTSGVYPARVTLTNSTF